MQGTLHGCKPPRVRRGSAGRPSLNIGLPHEICDLIWEGPAPWRTKISLFFEIYDEMPAYGHLLYAKHYYRSAPPTAPIGGIR